MPLGHLCPFLGGFLITFFVSLKPKLFLALDQIPLGLPIQQQYFIYHYQVSDYHHQLSSISEEVREKRAINASLRCEVIQQLFLNKWVTGSGTKSECFA